MNSFLLLAFVHFVAVITPGQSLIAMSRYITKYTNKNSWKFALGIACADSLYIILAIYGLTAIIMQSKIASAVFYAISGCYLLYLAGAMLLEKRSTFTNKLTNIRDENNAKTSPAFLQGLLVTIFNPEVGLFYSSIIAKFTNADSSFLYLFFIWGYMSLATFVLFYGISLVFVKYRTFFVKYMFYIEKIFSIFLLFIALHLAKHLARNLSMQLVF